MPKLLLLIGLGGFVGAIARYGLSGLVHDKLGVGFAWGTLAVNALGCLLIGVMMTLVEQRQLFSQELRMLVQVGFLGSLTTFSTLGFETFQYLREGDLRLVAANLLANVVLGLGAVVGGSALARLWC